MILLLRIYTLRGSRIQNKKQLKLVLIKIWRYMGLDSFLIFSIYLNNVSLICVIFVHPYTSILLFKTNYIFNVAQTYFQ